MPGLGNQPAPLVGVWVDSAKSSPADTSLWVLGGTGSDESRHIVHSPDGTTSETLRHYGYWFARGSVGDSVNRAICFTKRPGRSAPTCLLYSLDTAATPNGPRVRLLVHGYQGQHTTSDRILIALGS